MYICLCKGVTENDIEEAVASGQVQCMASLKRCLGVSTQCGGCESAAEETLSHCQAKTLSSTSRTSGVAIITPIVLRES